jgi:two-component system, NarL family, response regulator NreC
MSPGKDSIPISIILADEQKILRDGLRAMLESNPDLQVIGEAGTGQEALRLVAQLLPDVLVVALGLPELDGLEVLRQLRKRSPETRAVVLTMHNDESYVVQAFRNGAAGYLLKNSGADELVKAVRETAAKRYYFGPPFSYSSIAPYLQSTDFPWSDPYDSLSNREREVFQLVAEGRTNFEIGKRLFISPRTVEIHRANMMEKLGLRNHNELTLYAVKKKILPEP